MLSKTNQRHDVNLTESSSLPNLRSRSHFVDKETVVQALPDAVHNYEIYRPKSNSKVYKAKMSDMDGSLSMQTDSDINHIETSNEIHVENNVYLRNKPGDDICLRPPEYGMTTNGWKTENSSTSGYASSELTGSLRSQGHGRQEGMRDNEEIELSPIYESLGGVADNDPAVKLVKSSPLNTTTQYISSSR